MKINKTMIKKKNFQGSKHYFKNRAAFFENKEEIKFNDGDFIAFSNCSKLYLLRKEAKKN
jgi:hypothetical protein